MTAMRAARRMDELLTSPSEMVGFQAAGYALGVGAMWCSPRRLIHDAENGLVSAAAFRWSAARLVAAFFPLPPGDGGNTLEPGASAKRWLICATIGFLRLKYCADSMAICLSSG